MSPKLCRLVLAQVELKHDVADFCSVSGHFGVSFSGNKQYETEICENPMKIT